MNKTQSNTDSRITLKAVVAVIAIVVAPLLIFVVDFPSYNRMLLELQNSGHTVIFGIFALDLLSITANWASRLGARYCRGFGFPRIRRPIRPTAYG